MKKEAVIEIVKEIEKKWPNKMIYIEISKDNGISVTLKDLELKDSYIKAKTSKALVDAEHEYVEYIPYSVIKRIKVWTSTRAIKGAGWS